MACTLPANACSAGISCRDRTGQSARLAVHARRQMITDSSLFHIAQKRIRHQTQKLLGRRPSTSARCPQRKVQALMGSEELTQGIDKGTKIRVTKPVTVYHSPKLGDFNLEGQEGTVLDIVQNFKGKKLSANLPYKVEFRIPAEDKDVKLIAHLAAPEIEAAS